MKGNSHPESRHSVPPLIQPKSRLSVALCLVFRLPIYLYRLNPGQLLGNRSLGLSCLTTRVNEPYSGSVRVPRSGAGARCCGDDAAQVIAGGGSHRRRTWLALHLAGLNIGSRNKSVTSAR
jgi:hypothetical protein